MAYDVGTGTPSGRAVASGRSWVSWGAVFSGALIGMAVMTLLALFWFAIAAGEQNWVGNNIGWFIGGSAIVATFLAGVFAGWLGSRRGPAIGMVQGLTLWGLLTFAFVVVVPGLAATLQSLVRTEMTGGGEDWLWASFWTILIGLGAAVLGGTLGGSMVSPTPGPTPIGGDQGPAGGAEPYQTGTGTAPGTGTGARTDPYGPSSEHPRSPRR